VPIASEKTETGLLMVKSSDPQDLAREKREQSQSAEEQNLLRLELRKRIAGLSRDRTFAETWRHRGRPPVRMLELISSTTYERHF
jgi:hypothetical protein